MLAGRFLLSGLIINRCFIYKLNRIEYGVVPVFGIPLQQLRH